jgi:Zn-dependent protease
MTPDFIINLVIVLGVILVSMTLHEAMHAFVSFWLGDDTAKREGRLTLNPIKHIDPFLTILLPLGLALVGAPIFGAARPVPFRPDQVRWGDWGAALVALGGPLTNLLRTKGLKTTTLFDYLHLIATTLRVRCIMGGLTE